MIVLDPTGEKLNLMPLNVGPSGDHLEKRDSYAWGILEGGNSWMNRELITFAFYNNELVMITKQCDSFECWDKPCESPAWLYCK